MVVEKPDLPVVSHKFQGIFNANVFSELAIHTESEMIFFYDWTSYRAVHVTVYIEYIFDLHVRVLMCLFSWRP